MINVIDLFKKDVLQSNGNNYRTFCPSCDNSDRCFMLFTDNNTGYCHKSKKSFRLLEIHALQQGIISCSDGREKGEKKKVLAGELFSESLETFKDVYGIDKYNEIVNQLNIKTQIQLPGSYRMVSEFCNELGQIYKTRNVLFIRPESQDIVKIGKILINGKRIETGFINIKPAEFITFAENLIRPYSFNAKGETVVKSMTIPCSTATLASDQFKYQLPVLSRIFPVQLPIIYNDKLTFPKLGYDRRFNSWTPSNVPYINTEMKLSDAKTIIKNIYQEYPFKEEIHKHFAIAGLLTPFCRGLYNTFSTRTPVFIHEANRERAGKDHMAGITGITYEGVNVEEPAISTGSKNSNSNEELRKKILSCIMQGRKRFHSANNKGKFNNAIFEGITTAEHYNDRILGRSESIQLPNEMDFSMSGNLGLQLTPDMINRARIVRLHLVEEKANERVFKNPDLHKWVKDNRSLIISALYTLVREWDKKGRPKGSVPFTSFPDWANICGGIMESAGYLNPCVTDKSVMGIDTQTDDMKEFFECCYDEEPEELLSKKELYEIIENEQLFGYLNFNENKDKIKFSIMLNKYVDRELSGIILKSDNNRRASRRKYMFSKTITLNRPLNVIKLETPKKVEVVIEKSERELQYYEDPQCDNIKHECTEEEVYNLIKENSGKHHDFFLNIMKNGFLGHLNNLINNGKVKINDDDTITEV